MLTNTIRIATKPPRLKALTRWLLCHIETRPEIVESIAVLPILIRIRLPG
jgi:hypothetical protein